MDKKVLYRIYQITLFVVYIALMVFFIIMCLQNGTKSEASSNHVAETTADVINTVSGEEKVSASDESFKTFVRKFIGHYSFFVLLGTVSVFFYLSLKVFKKWFFVALHFAIGFSFALFSEFVLERMTEGRGASWTDAGIDCLGFITISLFVVLGYYIRKLILQKRKNA